MPALGTHVFQARKCLAEIEPKISIDRDFLGASAISHDTIALLPGAYGRVFNEAHNEKTEDYFLAVIGYIKKENLRENSSAMAFLYGQIMHYALDTKTHPLIYYMTECHPAKFLISALGAHTLFEAWYDMQLEEKEKLKEDEAFDPRYPFVKKVCEGGINPMINAAYEDVYGLENAAGGYKNGIKVWEIYQARLRRAMIHHVKKYHSDFEGMINSGGAYFLHPVTNVPLNATFDQAYESSIPLACELIGAADDNIYGGAGNEDTLKIAFGNSYDTGEDWKNPNPKRYFLGYK